MTTLVFAILAGTVLTLCIAVAVLWDVAGQRREERDEARDERDRVIAEHADLVTRLTERDDDAQWLPPWHTFLNPQAGPPADDVDTGLAALEDYANGEGR